MREAVGASLLVAVLATAGFIWFVLREGRTAVARVEAEDLALAAVRRVAAAQAQQHARHGHYGWLEDLRAAGLLGEIAVRELDGVLVGSTPRYRLDVLLPAATGTGEAIALVARGDARFSERLARLHFSVVARPLDEDEAGWRTYLLDERGRVYVNEGVSDPQTRRLPPLPVVVVPENGGLTPTGLRWWPLDDLPPR